MKKKLEIQLDILAGRIDPERDFLWYSMYKTMRGAIRVYGCSAKEYEELIKRKEHIIKQEVLPSKRYVSTVFTGMALKTRNHANPLVFETMVFKRENSSEELDGGRYASYKEAVKGHAALAKKWSGM